MYWTVAKGSFRVPNETRILNIERGLASTLWIGAERSQFFGSIFGGKHRGNNVRNMSTLLLAGTTAVRIIRAKARPGGSHSHVSNAYPDGVEQGIYRRRLTYPSESESDHEMIEQSID